MAFIDDKSQELPNQWASSLDFEKKITCMTINPSGHILAVGLASNEIVVCDAETSSNRYYYTEHQSTPISLSFSNNGHYLASGDKINHLIVRHLLERRIVYESNFNSKLLEVLFSPTETETLLILDSNRITLLNIFTGETKFIDGDFISVCWHTNDNRIFAAATKELVTFDSDFNILSTFQPEVKKNFIKIEISHNGLLLLIIENSGGCLLFQIEAQSVITTFQDSVGEMKWTSAAFDPKDELVVFASNKIALRTLTIYSLLDQGLLVSDLQGPNEPVGQIIYHPFHPVIYTRGVESIRVWTPTFLNSWSKFMPGFVDAFSNDLYYEKEDEFDEEEEHPEPEKIEHDDFIDVFTMSPSITSVYNTKERLNYLPLDVNALANPPNFNPNTIPRNF